MKNDEKHDEIHNFTTLFTKKMKNHMIFIKKCEKINDKYYSYESEKILNFPISKGVVCVFLGDLFNFRNFQFSKGCGVY